LSLYPRSGREQDRMKKKRGNAHAMFQGIVVDGLVIRDTHRPVVCHRWGVGEEKCRKNRG